MSVYSADLCLSSSDVNMFRVLRTSKLFEILQQAAVAQTEALGAGNSVVTEKGLMWVVTLQRADIARMPTYPENIRVETCFGNARHALFPRYYRILDAEGTTLVSASALWALVDIRSRRLVLPEDYGLILSVDAAGFESPLPKSPKKHTPDSTLSFTVPFSYTDINGHMNNTRYFDLAEDIFPAAAEGKRLKAVISEYSAELLLGDKISLDIYNAENIFTVSGRTDRRCFTVRLEYE